MQQMDINGHQLIELDFEDSWYSNAVRTLRPVAYRVGSRIHCTLGPDAEHSITGSGDTLVEALASWESELRKRIMYHTPNDETAWYVTDQLNASVKKIN